MMVELYVKNTAEKFEYLIFYKWVSRAVLIYNFLLHLVEHLTRNYDTVTL